MDKNILRSFIDYIHEGQIFKCVQCEHKATSKNIMQEHIKSVHGIEILICPDCDKPFTSKRSLLGHKKEKHSEFVKVYTCVDCGKKFTRKSNLKYHKNSCFRHFIAKDDQKDEKMENLEHGFTLSYEVSTKEHQLEAQPLIVPNTQVLKCEKCYYKTTRKFNLQQHVWRQHARPNKPPIKPKILPKCTYCEFSSESSHNVRRHEEKCSFSGPEIFCVL